MKKFMGLLLILGVLAGCQIKVGELPPERKKLYEMGNDICQKDPTRCVNGIPW